MDEEAFAVLIAGEGGGDVAIYLNRRFVLREFVNKRYLKRK
jgi:hypothetical protein